MQEAFLHFVWRYQYYAPQELRTTLGQRLYIEHPGYYNRDAGPDFLQARVKIDDTEWAGHIEIHIKSSDWQQHQHQRDAAYETVVLHVVLEEDIPIILSDGTRIPCLELHNRLDGALLQRYQRLQRQQQWIPCAALIKQVPEEEINLWLQRLLIERLEQKTAPIRTQLTNSKQDWEAAFYESIAGSLGLKVNIDPMRALAACTPLQLLRKYRDRLQRLEALLFGQAGMLEQEPLDDYQAKLQDDYHFLAHKHKLAPLQAVQWKFARMRPAGFPTIRIAQLAMLVFSGDHLFSRLQAAGSLKEIRTMLNVQVSPYWQRHHRFAQAGTKSARRLGQVAVDRLLINTLVPFLFLYGQQRSQPAQVDKALQLLTALRAEDNRILRGWEELGLQASTADQSQALLHLKKHYCDQQRCLDCAIGLRLLRALPGAQALKEPAPEYRDWEGRQQILDSDLSQLEQTNTDRYD